MREEIQGIAYALFKTTNAAKIPITKNHFKIRDRDLRLCKARPDSPQGSHVVSTTGSWCKMNPIADRMNGKHPAEPGLSNILAKRSQ
jgi:hypothetical protein